MSILKKKAVVESTNRFKRPKVVASDTDGTAALKEEDLFEVANDASNDSVDKSQIPSATKKLKDERLKQLKKNKEGAISCWDMYADMLANKIASGYNEKPAVIPDNQLRVGISSIYTKRYIKRVLILRTYPNYMDEDFNNIIRTVAGDKVEVNIIYSSQPYKPNFEKPAIRRRMKQFANAYERFKKLQKERSVKDELLISDEELKTESVNSQMVRSFQFITDMNRTQSCLSLMYVSIELISLYRLDNSNKYLPDYEAAQKNIEEAVSKVKNYAVGAGMKTYTPFMNCLEYMKGFYPASADDYSIVKDMVLPAMVNDRSISKLYSYNQGEIKGSGVYVGTDIMTQIPIHREFTSNINAQNVFVVAKTGKGKSFYFKTELLYFLGNRYRGIIVDYEGDEYTEIADYLGAPTIKFSINNGRYFDTTEIGDLTGIEKIDVDLYEEAIHATEHIFDLLIGGENEMNFAQRAIFGDVIKEVYRDLGVDEYDRSTWVNSKKCSYKLIFNKIKHFMDINFYNMEHNHAAAVTMYDALRVYFGETGVKSKMFKNRISINDIQSHDLVVFSFGMRGVNMQTVSKSDIALRQSCVAYLISLYANYNKAMGNRNDEIDRQVKENPNRNNADLLSQKVDVGNGFTVIAFEEVQRYWQTAGSKSIISDVITGARKRDAVVYLMSNSPMSIVEAMNSSEASDVKDNITTLLIGRLEAVTATKVAKAFDIEDCIPYLVNMSRSKKYNHCFLAAFDKEEFAIVKAEVKPSLAESKLFATRRVDTSKKAGEEEDDANYSLSEASSAANIDFKSLLAEVASV